MSHLKRYFLIDINLTYIKFCNHYTFNLSSVNMSLKCLKCFKIFDEKSNYDEHIKFCITKSICNSCKNLKQLVTKYNCASCLSFLPECRTCKRCIVQGTGSQCDSCIKKNLKLSKSRLKKHKCPNCTNMYKRLKYLRKHLELLINESCLQNCTLED